MKVAIIGCGYSGLSAIRRCNEFGFDCVAFELSNGVGGLWRYTDRVGADEFGLPIQTSLYESLRTNSPKHTLELPGFPLDTKEPISYLHHTEICRYLEEFSVHFNLLPHIKFRHYVTSVSRVDGEWKITVKNLNEAKGRYENFHFDAVMVCNGHTTQPSIPQIAGYQTFKGCQFHCHEYRRKTIFLGKNVLIIGSGPSGIEIAQESSSVARKTFLSHRNGSSLNFPLIITKPDVKMITEYTVLFSDESTEAIDIIIFCTGYEYYYPFLHQSCGIRVKEEGQIVEPLYKHYINIEEPTMSLIGLFQRVIVSYLFDLQVQAFLKFLSGQIHLPFKTEMLKWLECENERKKRLQIPPNRYYHLSDEIENYFGDITHEAQLSNIPPVLLKIFHQNEETYVKNYNDHRYWNFEILDDYNYTATLKYF